MKKRVITLFVVCLAVMALLCGCGGQKADPDSPFIGNWTMTSGEMMGISMTAEELGMGDVTLELNENGKATLTFDGDGASCNWIENEDGTASLEEAGEELVLVLAEDGTMSLDYSGITLVFAKAE